MSATPRDQAEAMRVLYSTYRAAGEPLPLTREGVASALVAIAGALPPSRTARAEAALLVAAELRGSGTGSL